VNQNMLENVLIFNILKVIYLDFSVCYTFVLKFHLLLSNFYSWECKVWFLSPGVGYPRYFTNTHKTGTGIWKVCNYTKLNKPRFTNSLSRKYERIFSL